MSQSARNTRSTSGLSVRKYKTAVRNTARNTYSRNCPCPAVSAKDRNEAASSSPNSTSAAVPARGRSCRSARSRSYTRHSPSPSSAPCAKVSACAETGISISRTGGRKSRRAEYRPRTRSRRRSRRPGPARRRWTAAASRISVSSKLSTSRTPVMERRLRESSVSRCGCWARFVSISACCMVSSFLLSGYAGFSLHIYAGNRIVCSNMIRYISRYMAAASSLRTASATASTSTVTVRAPKALEI